MTIPTKGSHFVVCRRRGLSLGLLACWVLALQIGGSHTGAFASEQSTSSLAELDTRPPELLLIAAVTTKRLDVVQRLVRDGVDVNSSVPGEGTALIVACRRGDLETINELLRLGADVNRAARGDGNPLIAAAITGNLRVIQRLLGAGADVNAIVSTDETPLINAARAGKLAAVKNLVEHGADVNLSVTADNGQWRSPLNQSHDSEIRNYLVSRGAGR